MSAKDSTGTSSTADTGCDDPTKTINVCLHKGTHTRLTAYKNYNPVQRKTFDQAVNEILDEIEFPESDEFESKYIPSMSFNNTSSDDDD